MRGELEKRVHLSPFQKIPELLLGVGVQILQLLLADRVGEVADRSKTFQRRVHHKSRENIADGKYP